MTGGPFFVNFRRSSATHFYPPCSADICRGKPAANIDSARFAKLRGIGESVACIDKCAPSTAEDGRESMLPRGFSYGCRALKGIHSRTTNFPPAPTPTPPPPRRWCTVQRGWSLRATCTYFGAHISGVDRAWPEAWGTAQRDRRKDTQQVVEGGVGCRGVRADRIEGVIPREPTVQRRVYSSKTWFTRTPSPLPSTPPRSPGRRRRSMENWRHVDEAWPMIPNRISALGSLPL